MLSNLNLKQEYKNKTITVKPNNHTTSIHINLWNLNDTMAQWLVDKGYGHIFEEKQDDGLVGMKTILENEGEHPIVITDTTTDCNCKNKSRRGKKQ